jgi:HSP20 family protein
MLPCRMRSPLHAWLARPDCDADHGAASHWVPAVDVIETPASYIVLAELPGMSVADFSIEASAGSLALAGIRQTREARCDSYLRLERHDGEFRRTFSFAEPVDAGAVTATYTDGVLRLDLPKAGPHGPRTIEIG